MKTALGNGDDSIDGMHFGETNSGLSGRAGRSGALPIPISCILPSLDKE